MALKHTVPVWEEIHVKVGKNIMGKIVGDPLTRERKERKGIIIAFFFQPMLCIFIQLLKKKNQKNHLGTKNLRVKLLMQMHINFLFLYIFYMAAEYFHPKYGKEACSTHVRCKIFLALKYS